MFSTRRVQLYINYCMHLQGIPLLVPYSANVAKTTSLPNSGQIRDFLIKQIHSENHVIFS